MDVDQSLYQLFAKSRALVQTECHDSSVIKFGRTKHSCMSHREPTQRHIMRILHELQRVEEAVCTSNYGLLCMGPAMTTAHSRGLVSLDQARQWRFTPRWVVPTACTQPPGFRLQAPGPPFQWRDHEEMLLLFASHQGSQ